MAEATLVCETPVSPSQENGISSNTAFLSPRNQLISQGRISGGSIAFTELLALDADLYIFMLNPGDLMRAAKQFQALYMSHKEKKLRVFSIQRGVQEDFVLQDALLEHKGAVVINGLLAWDAVRLDSGALAPYIARGSLTLERLTKRNVGSMDGATRLLEATELNIQFRKSLGKDAWGLLIYEHLCAVSLLTRGSVYSTLRSWSARRLAAYMVRESCVCLAVVGRQGEWRPTLYSVSLLTPYLLELALLLPTFLFLPLLHLGLFPAPELPCPGQIDVQQRRKVNALWNLDELLKTAAKHNVKAPLCAAVRKHIAELEQNGYTTSCAPDDKRIAELSTALIPSSYSLYSRSVGASKHIKFYLVYGVFVIAVFAALIPLLAVIPW